VETYLNEYHSNHLRIWGPYFHNPYTHNLTSTTCEGALNSP